MINGFEDRRLGPLGYTRCVRRETGDKRVLQSRVFLNLPPPGFGPGTFGLEDRRSDPVELRRRVCDLGGRVRTCEHWIPSPARVAICWNAQVVRQTFQPVAAAARKPAVRFWLRVKDSNLDLLVQSQPSGRLDEPEI